jgi:hypothetical protein
MSWSVVAVCVSVSSLVAASSPAPQAQHQGLLRLVLAPHSNH